MTEQVTTGRIVRPTPGGSAAARLKAHNDTVFGLGGCACQEEWEVPADYDLDKLRCQYDRLPQAISVPGASAATLTIQPTVGSNYFCPVAWLSSVKDGTDPQLGRSVRITDVTIGPCTLLPFSNRAPVAGTLQFIDSDELDPDGRDNCACPTPRWPCFSTAALNCPLSIVIFNSNPAGITAIVQIEVLGRSISSCLDWKQATVNSSVPRIVMPMA